MAILLVLAIVAISYYAVVVNGYGPALLAASAAGLEGTGIGAALLVLVFHVLLVMLLWSYLSVILTDPGSVPPNWMPAFDEEKGDAVSSASVEIGGPVSIAHQPSAHTEKSTSKIRFCWKCNNLQPPRSRHCSVCGKCILKMDHHCLWVVNCIGAMNYKSFLLFLLYTYLETTLVAASLFPNIVAFFGQVELPETPGILTTTFLAFILNSAFSLSILGLLIMHISLVFSNTTTIEACYEKGTTPRWRYDVGRRKNFEQVFGISKMYWFFPLYSEEDMRRMPALQGLEYPSKSEIGSQNF